MATTDRKPSVLIFVPILVLLAATVMLLPSGASTQAQQTQQTQQGQQPLEPVGSGFTYQGRLKDGGNPANGQYDFIFTLYDADTGGTQVGSPVTVDGQTVTEGLFTVQLDFGSGVFGGEARWLEIAVRQAGGGTYTTLSPLQPMTAVPYAMSLATGSSGAVISGTVEEGPSLAVTNTYQYGIGIFGRGGSNGIGSIGVHGIGYTGVLGQSSESLGYGLYGSNPNGVGVRGHSDFNNGVYGDSTSGRGVYGESNTGHGVYGKSLSNSNGYGVYGESANSIAVYGFSSSNGRGVSGYSGSGTGGYFQSTSGNGVSGISTTANGVRGDTSAGFGYAGVYAASYGSNGAGVYGFANGGPNAVGIRGESGVGYAGYFDGRVEVTGTCCASGAGTFKIDHPLDPENKYLVQSAVQSADMLSIYNGNATTNSQGEAIVTLPEYVEALNQDFRYQLTVVGQFAQAIVSDEIRYNRFTIKTDKPSVKVSWQVTGIRNDPYAKAHPIDAEVQKSLEEKGKYRHPTEHGQPESKKINQWPQQEEKVVPKPQEPKP